MCEPAGAGQGPARDRCAASHGPSHRCLFFPQSCPTEPGLPQLPEQSPGLFPLSCEVLRGGIHKGLAQHHFSPPPPLGRPFLPFRMYFNGVRSRWMAPGTGRGAARGLPPTPGPSELWRPCPEPGPRGLPEEVLRLRPGAGAGAPEGPRLGFGLTLILNCSLPAPAPGPSPSVGEENRGGP